MAKLKSYGVFCDDIRQEISGKYILIGLYSGDLIPSVLPLPVSLSTMIWVSGLSAGQHPFKVTISVDSSTIHEIEGVMQVADQTQQSHVVLAGFPLHFEKPCLVEAKIEVKKTTLNSAQLRVVSHPDHGIFG